MTAPNKILIQSDNNEMTLVRTMKTKTEITYEYQFTKSETKEGLIMTISEENLIKNLKREIFKEWN